MAFAVAGQVDNQESFSAARIAFQILFGCSCNIWWSLNRMFDIPSKGALNIPLDSREDFLVLIFGQVWTK
jgi:hypothetical protein